MGHPEVIVNKPFNTLVSLSLNLLPHRPTSPKGPRLYTYCVLGPAR